MMRRARRQDRQASQDRQRGAALLTAMLVVTLAAVLVSGLLWRQQVALRRVENQREAEQARWLSRGAIDWARLILRAQGDSAPVTYLGGTWNVPIAPTRLSDFLGRIGVSGAQQGAATWISGQVVDAQALFNLRNLVKPGDGGDLSVDVDALQAFEKLMSVLGLNRQLADAAAVYMRTSLLASPTAARQAASGDGQLPTPGALNGSAGSMDTRAGMAAQTGGRPGGATGFTDDPGLRGSREAQQMAWPLPAQSVDSLLDVPGFNAAVLARLRPFVTVLPVPTQVNLNTAGAEVIAASIPALTLADAQQIVAARDQAFFVNLGDAQTRMARFMPTATPLPGTRFDVTTRYFEVHARVQHQRAVVDRVALIYRDPRTHTTRAIAVRDAGESGHE